MQFFLRIPCHFCLYFNALRFPGPALIQLRVPLVQNFTKMGALRDRLYHAEGRPTGQTRRR